MWYKTEVSRIFKHVFPFMIIILLLACTGASLAAEKPEFRAMWVSSYGPRADVITPEGIDLLIEHAKLANLNALVVQVRKTGDALYKSDYEPRAENLALPDFDPLDYTIKRAHAAGLEVHAWLNTHKVWAGETPPESPDHPFNKHPEWINKCITGRLDKMGPYALDPGIREAQQHIFNVYMDVVKKYDIDGIHFDYVRYWSPDYGYSDLAVARFNKEKGRTGIPEMTDPEWSQWRRDRVTDLVRQVYTGVKKTKPHVKVTASVVCSRECAPEFKDTHPYRTLLQDWERWTREGIIDAVIPMNYKSESDPEAAKLFREWIDAMVRWRHDRHAYNGMSTRNVDGFIAQIGASRKGGTDGVVGFAFNASRNRMPLATTLREAVFQTRVPVAPMPWKPARASGGPEEPAGPKELFNRAIFYASKGNDLDKAIALLKEAIAQDINFAEAHFRLGRCYLRKGMKTEAAAEFRETLEINPSHGGALVELERMEGAE